MRASLRESKRRQGRQKSALGRRTEVNSLGAIGYRESQRAPRVCEPAEADAPSRDWSIHQAPLRCLIAA